uniref:Homeobox domain-containing protein n=1 Tax=Panagrellus redivivus TaxID=6233 RepID=A0A7E4W0F4_PANRE
MTSTSKSGINKVMEWQETSREKEGNLNGSSSSTSTGSPVNKDISDISDDQLACLCKSLRYTESIPKLERLLTQLPEDRVRTNEDVMISKAVILYHQKRFTELFELLQSFKFASENHEMLQEIWKNAHYEQTESKRPKPLDAVTKYRLRKKHVYPMTIWDGETTSYCFKNSSRKILQAAYKKNQMPSPEEKKALAIKAKLELGQVSNWFKNRRQRDRQQQKLGSNSPHSNDDDDTDSFASRSSPSLSPPSSAASGSASASTNAAANPAGVAPISNATPPIMPCGAAGYWPMGPSTVGGGYGSSCATGVNGQNNYFYNFEHLNQLAAAAYGGAGGYGFGGMSADMTSL